jgi:phosphoribosyl 1,2-cyclic phosphodiesterase
VRLVFCGVRGSMPAAGPEFARYGGHTSCVAIGAGDDDPVLVLDAGTGLRRLSALLGGRPFRGSVLVSHLHWDHVHGMPFFVAGFRTGARVDVRIPTQDDDGGSVGRDAAAALARSMSPPSFPIVPSQLGEAWGFSSLDEGACAVEGFSVLAREVPHKGGRTFGYRVDDGVSSVAYLSDHDPLVLGPGHDGLGARHEAALALARDVDLLVHDAHITAAEIPRLGFLGHASAEYALRLGAEAGARAVALFHHAWERTDDALDALADDWRSASPVPLVLAREGLCLDLPGGLAAAVTSTVVTTGT